MYAHMPYCEESCIGMQVSLLQRLAVQNGWPSLETLTIDKYQGRDKEVILLSLVRNNPGAQAGSLLADWRRVNVAITRAKCKLLVVGSARTVSSVPLLAHFVRLVEERGWMLRLGSAALA
jgi:DNA replication ATP-dependent helicase Dna2